MGIVDLLKLILEELGFTLVMIDKLNISHESASFPIG